MLQWVSFANPLFTPGVIGVVFSSEPPPLCASPSAAYLLRSPNVMPLCSADSSVACRNTLEARQPLLGCYRPEKGQDGSVYFGTTGSSSLFAASMASFHLAVHKHHLQPGVKPIDLKLLPREAEKSKNSRVSLQVFRFSISSSSQMISVKRSDFGEDAAQTFGRSLNALERGQRCLKDVTHWPATA